MIEALRILASILIAAGFVVWCVAVVTGVRLLRRRSGRMSLGALAWRGIAWFDARNFQPEAAGLVRTLRLAFVVFFACIFLAGAASMVSLVLAGSI